jgi:uncharacterized protein (TIGR00369 family)
MTSDDELHPLPEFDRVPDEYGPPFHNVLGVKMGVGVGGEGIAWVDVDPEVHYGARWAHGGLAGALADIASGIAVARNVPNPIEAIDGTIEMKVNFIRKVVDGDFTACARLLHLGKRVAVTDVELTNKGRLCAKAIATFMLREPDAGSSP